MPARRAPITTSTACLAGARFAMPVSANRISSHFGTRVHPITGARHVHSGVDLAAPAGRAVHAAERGVVSFIGTEPRGYGKYVVIRHDGGYASYYAHLSAFEPTLRTGMRVARGQRVGAVGSTGTATGPHLHFEVRRHARLVDPVALVQAGKAAKLKGERRVAFNRVVVDARTRLASAGGRSRWRSRSLPDRGPVDGWRDAAGVGGRHRCMCASARAPAMTQGGSSCEAASRQSCAVIARLIHRRMASNLPTASIHLLHCFQGLPATRQIQPLYFPACLRRRSRSVCRNAAAHPIPLFPNPKLIPR